MMVVSVMERVSSLSPRVVSQGLVPPRGPATYVPPEGGTCRSGGGGTYWYSRVGGGMEVGVMC